MTDTQKPSLNKTFGSKTKGSQSSYGHPHSQSLLESACDMIRQSETGAKLLRLLDFKKVPVHIIKGNGQSGFTPELMTIYMQAPGNMTTASDVFIIELIKSLNEAAQELAGLKAPDPIKDIMDYAAFIHSRNLDSITEVCRVVKELTSSGNFTNLIDSMAELGLNGVYKAHIDGKSREELYEKYAMAYDAAMSRGSRNI